jgi:hypothetical protein
MTKRLSNDEIKERISKFGFSILNDITTIKQIGHFRCSHNHEWFTRVERVIYGSTGCKKCSDQSQKTSIEEIDRRLASRGITMVDEYKNARTRSLFRCSCGNEWKALVHSVASLSSTTPTGCPRCQINNLADTLRSSKDSVNERLAHKGIVMISDYKTARTRSLFRCSLDHEWETTPDSVLRNNCPSCANYGFSPQKSAHVYILKFDSFIKYGITNNLDRRLKEHERSNGSFVIIETLLFDNGEEAFLLERAIRQHFGGSFVTKDICQDGYTETLSLELIEEVKTFIINHSISTK